MTMIVSGIAFGVVLLIVVLVGLAIEEDPWDRP